jgi:hypothetical protein
MVEIFADLYDVEFVDGPSEAELLQSVQTIVMRKTFGFNAPLLELSDDGEDVLAIAGLSNEDNSSSFIYARI